MTPLITEALCSEFWIPCIQRARSSVINLIVAPAARSSLRKTSAFRASQIFRSAAMSANVHVALSSLVCLHLIHRSSMASGGTLFGCGLVFSVQSPLLQISRVRFATSAQKSSSD